VAEPPAPVAAPRGASVEIDVPPGIAMMLDVTSFHDRDLGSPSFAEVLTAESRNAPAAPPPAAQLEIEPPPWKDFEDGLDLASVQIEAPPPPPPTALSVMRFESGDVEIEFPGPPVSYPPLEPITLPEPNWEIEEREQRELREAEQQRLSREQRARLLQELLEEQQQPAYPAAPKRKRAS
jgi:hypothetical protein